MDTQRLRLERHSRPFIPLIIIALLTKAGLATVTPSSYDFSNIAACAFRVSEGVVFQGPYTFSANLMHLFYAIWLLIPVDHEWIYSGHSFMASLSSFLLVFLLKLPLLVSDVLTALVIYKIVSSVKAPRGAEIYATLIWLFNPYLTVAVEMDGTVDIVSTFLVVLATYLYIQGRYSVSGVCLGLATAARFYPIALVPLYGVLLLKDGRVRGLFSMIASYCALLTLAVFPFVAIYGMDFLNALYKLPAGGNKEFIWFFGFRPWAPTSGQEISSVVTVVVVIGLLALRAWKAKRRTIMDLVLIALITYVGLSHWNRYYTVWVTPFLTMDFAVNCNSASKNLYKILYILFFLSAFMYNFAYWWSSSLLFVYEFTPEMGVVGTFMRQVGGMLRMGDLGTTFSQSVLAAVCILYVATAVTRNTVGAYAHYDRSRPVLSSLESSSCG